MWLAFRAATVLAFAVAAIERAEATPFIPDRATLELILGGDSVTEDFERFVFSSGSLGNDLVAGLLDAQTITNSLGGNARQGPGIVSDGVSFYGNSGFIWWTRDGFLGLDTQTIYAGGHIFGFVDTINIRFTQPTTAFGVDVALFGGDGTDTLTTTVFAPDLQTVLGMMSGVRLDGPTPAFIGFSEPSGIGLVELTRSRRFVPVPLAIDSPAIDNVTFGPTPTVVPEPGSASLLALALAAMRVWRKSSTRRSRCGHSRRSHAATKAVVH